MITSVQNPKIKWLRLLQAQSKARRDEGVFIVEGVRLAEEALNAGWRARLVLTSQALNERGRQVLAGFAAQGALLEEASEHVLQAASDTQTPQGLLAVLEMRELQTPETLNFVLVADGLRDPGNLGTILRSAAAAGVDLVYLPEGGVDVYAPKVMRAGMGAHFRLAVKTATWEEISATIQKLGLHAYLADASGDTLYTRADLSVPLALVLGGEASGPSQAARALAERVLRIPMHKRMESLNAASAAAILLYEVVRQRSQSD